MNEHEKTNFRGAQTIFGKLSGKNISIPNVNDPPMAVMAPASQD
jgi:acetaldehyde dehydrogenase (acetylating)